MLAVTLLYIFASIAVEATPFTPGPRDLASPSTSQRQAQTITETPSATLPVPIIPEDVTKVAQERNPDDPIITAAPDKLDLNDVNLKFKQTTYYTCVTIGTYSHCGTHRPILDASAASSIGRGRTNLRSAAVGVVVAMGLLLI